MTKSSGPEKKEPPLISHRVSGAEISPRSSRISVRDSLRKLPSSSLNRGTNCNQGHHWNWIMSHIQQPVHVNSRSHHRYHRVIINLLSFNGFTSLGRISMHCSWCWSVSSKRMRTSPPRPDILIRSMERQGSKYRILMHSLVNFERTKVN